MQSRHIAVCGLLLGASLALAAPIKLEVLKVGSKTYSNITVVGANATDLYFTYAQGITSVRLKYLDPQTQRAYGYEPKLAAAAEKQQLEDDARYQESLRSNIIAQAEEKIHESQRAALTSENSLADPTSEKSWLGKSPPPLLVEKWMGETPVLTNKPVLIVFWEPWSIPCRKWLPTGSALRKKWGGRLTIVGICSEPEAAIAKLAEGKPDFPCGVDATGGLSAALGVTSVPCVLLMDEKHVVRYLGHPAALDDRKIEEFLPSPPQ
jgi:hypothetical protein